MVACAVVISAAEPVTVMLVVKVGLTVAIEDTEALALISVVRAEVVELIAAAEHANTIPVFN